MNKKLLKKKLAGFTLIELLVVIAIIVILFAVILVAVDPAKRIGQAQDAVRRQDVRDISEAIQEYIVDNNGSFPSGLIADGSYKMLGACSSGASCVAQTVPEACLDLSGFLVDKYLAEMPMDPENGSAAQTGYYIYRATDSNRIEVGACDTNSGVIKVKR
ncbi:MAG: prepilin-type N-terminal cleavage/methylation domain-containing protein [Patescibacteria group bacterium]|nr:prepilin-type N-terminal cleavage/methylation domain-containing protein [Patescibacteria group bacterium]MDD5490415.1 prepilin-type N-terminal cleavage/methylation domain-containing protein [Patescibacteria group bacterium]